MIPRLRISPSLHRFARTRWAPALVALSAALLALGVWQKSISDSADAMFRAGRIHLDRGEPADALREFESSLVRRNRAATHLFAARAARRTDDFNGAKAHLKQAESLGADPQSIELERAVLNAQTGSFAESERALLAAVEAGSELSAEILALVVPRFLRDFRIVEADGLTARWVVLQPRSTAAWSIRADVLERLRKKDDALEALRQWVLLEPEGRVARFQLARLSLESRLPPGEAAGQLEWLLASGDPNPEVKIQLALAREVQGRTPEAVALLDRVLAESGENARALHIRGRLEMNAGRPAGAAKYLKRAIEADPSDIELLYSHFLCLQQSGTPAEVRAAEERWKKCDADLRRAGELARIIAAEPRIPETRCEIGELFVRNGRVQEGLRWLDSALRLDPKHARTHSVIAEYYERVGETELARQHRLFTEK